MPVTRRGCLHGERAAKVTAMRIGTWNCRQRIDDKLGAVTELGCDVLVVPECAKRPGLARQPGVSFAWSGDYELKGLGVFGFRGWTLTPATAPRDVPWCMPLAVADPAGVARFTLIAIWTVKRPRDGRPDYVGQFREVIEVWRDAIADDDIVIAGDLNASLSGPTGERHRANLDSLGEIGAVSAFHDRNAVAHGAEEAMTLRWIGPGRVPYHFHCDYVFLSAGLAERAVGAQIGDVATWIESGRSDHCPVTVDLDLHGS